MAKVQVLQWAADLSGAQAAAPESELVYNDLMTNVAEQGWFMVASLIAAPSTETDTAEFVLPDGGTRIQAVFYDNRMLSQATKRELEATAPRWRDQVGDPAAWLTEDLSDTHFRLHPRPRASRSTIFAFTHGAPFGQDLPSDAVIVLHAQVRPDLPTWLDLPLGLAVLGHEFNRLSDHRKTDFTAACQGLSRLLVGLLG